MKRLSDKVYDALRSVRLAAALIILMALLAVAGGIIPQGKTNLFYTQNFPGVAARIILSAGLDKVFTGIPFLLLATIFTINLAVCSFHRFASELNKSRANRRHGPDLLHIGLLVFIFGGILTSRTRTEDFLSMGKGDAAQLPDGSRIVLVSLSEERYPDGRAKSWESRIVIGATTTDPLPDTATTSIIKVNSPLRYKGYTIYQQGWKSETRVVLENQAGKRLSLKPGIWTQVPDGKVLLMAVEKYKPTVEGAEDDSNYEATFLVENGSSREVLKTRKGGKVGLFTFAGFEEEPLSGLNVVRDKGYPFVVAGLALVVLGTFLTYLRKLKGMLA